MIISLICHKHGYIKGSACHKCSGGNEAPFNTTRDQLFNFTDNKNFKHPKEIHGKDHWYRELKKAGLHDDKVTKWPDRKEERREGLKKAIHESIKDIREKRRVYA